MPGSLLGTLQSQGFELSDPQVPFVLIYINVLILVDFPISFTNFYWSILSKIYCTYKKISVCDFWVSAFIALCLIWTKEKMFY